LENESRGRGNTSAIKRRDASSLKEKADVHDIRKADLPHRVIGRDLHLVAVLVKQPTTQGLAVGLRIYLS